MVFIRKTAEDRGFSWAYWQFDADFVVYDVETNKWNEPILKASDSQVALIAKHAVKAAADLQSSRARCKS